MVAYLILGVALLMGFVLLSKWFVTADTESVGKALKIVGVLFGVLLVAYLLVSGRWVFLPALLLGALPWLGRLRRFGRHPGFGGFAAGPSPGQSSGVDTRYLRMLLDHESGTMDGEVIAGRFQGRTLGSMGFEELLALLAECRAEDEQSERVLEAYLDRVHGADWRERASEADAGKAGAGWGGGSSRAAGGSAMSRAEAYEILGLAPGASEAEIKEAYHRLIGKIHPDAGGSTYLAAKINQAKDLLLGS